jgi:lipopolysaccharide/colanic/teichoic acid biosynthesis glycosyltransferase
VTKKEWIIKRSFDIFLSIVGIIFSTPIIVVAIIVASIETRSFGLFLQRRVGRYGKIFIVYKIKTMRSIEGIDSTVTTKDDIRITKSGKFMRDTKIDELPQLFNVLLGSMSFVGARPDVEGFADKLEGEDRVILSIPPAITGPASLKYRDEEAILAREDNPQKYNREVIWRDKVAINREYIKNWSFMGDIRYILETIM